MILLRQRVYSGDDKKPLLSASSDVSSTTSSSSSNKSKKGDFWKTTWKVAKDAMGIGKGGIL